MIKIKLPKIPLLNDPQGALARHNNIYMVKALEVTHTAARQFTPVGVSANLKGLITTRRLIGDKSGVVGQVVWNAPYAKAVDEGTRPHLPPIRPLLRWAEVKLGDRSLGWAVRAKIAKEGTKGQQFVEATRVNITPTLNHLFRDQMARYARELQG